MCVRFSPNSRYLAIADMEARVIVCFGLLEDLLSASFISFFPGVGCPQETNAQHFQRS